MKGETSGDARVNCIEYTYVHLCLSESDILNKRLFGWPFDLSKQIKLIKLDSGRGEDFSVI